MRPAAAAAVAAAAAGFGCCGSPAAAALPQFQFVSSVHVAPPPTSVTERRGFHFVLATPPPAGETVAGRDGGGDGGEGDALTVFGCGIDGELVAVDFSDPAHPEAANATAIGAPLLLQARTMLWEDLGRNVSAASTGIATVREPAALVRRLVVSSRDLLFFEPNAGAANGLPLRLVANVSTPMSGLPSKVASGDTGINGLVQVADAAGTRLLIGAAMPGLLVAAVLSNASSSDSSAHAAAPMSTPMTQPLPSYFGSIDLQALDWLGAAFDIDSYVAPTPGAAAVAVGTGRRGSAGTGTGGGAVTPPTAAAPIAVVVSARQSVEAPAVVGTFQLTDRATGVFLPPGEWTMLGGTVLPAQYWGANGGGGGVVGRGSGNRRGSSGAGAASPTSRARKGATGCNRVRVHAASARAAFSCFGGGPGHDIVGFVDLADPAAPGLLGIVPFVTQQPTGMLVVGDVLFVAGELDLMAFDMRAGSSNASHPTPPLLGTCGAACAAVGNATGQNFHSLSHRAVPANRSGSGDFAERHLLFLSAQIDNAVGCVEITDPAIIALL